MIIDGRQAAAPDRETCDVVVIGAGPAGISLALELMETGLKVVVLESGGETFDADTQMLYDGAVSGHPYTPDLAAIRLRYLGGTMNHWGGRCVPLDEIDFARAPLSGETGWPIGRADLLPYYERSHPYFGIGDFQYDPLAIDGVGRDDVLLSDSEIVDTVVIRQSEANFAQDFRDRLASARDVEVRLWSNVTELQTTPDGEVTEVVARSLSGQIQRIRGRFVVLACGAVENARQLLAHNARTGARLGDATGYLGRCYMDHPAAGAGFLWPEQPLPPQIYWTLPETSDGTAIRFLWRLSEETMDRENLANAQFYLIPFNEDRDPRIREANRGWSALRNVAKWSLGRDIPQFELSQAYCEVINSADTLAADAFGLIDRSETANRVLLKFETEQQPDRGNRVTLAEDMDALGQPQATLHWWPGEQDRESLLRTTMLIGQAVGAEGLGRIELEDHFDEPGWGTVTSWHQMGTTRMATSPRNGVVDPDCRVHGSANLYVAGGSVMPTAGRANPTLTIVALAIRLADHLKQRMAG